MVDKISKLKDSFKEVTHFFQTNEDQFLIFVKTPKHIG